MKDVLTRDQYDEMHAYNRILFDTLRGKSNADLSSLNADTLVKVRDVLGPDTLEPASSTKLNSDTSGMDNLGLAIELYNRNREWLEQYQLGLLTLQAIAKGEKLPWKPDPAFHEKIVKALNTLRPALESLLGDIDVHKK